MASTNIDIESLLRLAEEQKIEAIKDQAVSLEELRDALMQQANFYREENAKMEAVLKKLHLLPHQLNAQSRAELEKLTNLQEKYETKQCSSEAVGLSHAERLRKQSNYVTKIKSCIKIYNNLIEKLVKEIKTAKAKLEHSEKKLSSLDVSNDEIKILQTKIERYEKELLKFEKKYPWLKDPQYKLQNISKETDALNTLRKEKEKLIQELEVYQGLKPDIYEANKQLTDIKHEYDSIK